ncbi:MAG: hexameric tyrosine-coordinated heme protein [Paracoccus sp. (in: a-proteobacteria)]|nr:hexameric tyrosine-coordinated heme protein [Paracoccus sp. (in: a-proteobacteria)]
MGLAQDAQTEVPWLETLITETPQQGFDLSITLARRAVKTTQPDVEVLKAQRPVYATDAGDLIDVSGVAAAWFATVAAANDYWRD